jgi:His Kinase A (phospho-acceptor) domain
MSGSDLRAAMFEPGRAAAGAGDPGAAGGGAPGAAQTGDRGAGPAGSLDGRQDRVSQATSWPRLCHDLRTPLNAILGNAELLLDGSAGPLSSEARACLGDIQSAAGRTMRHVQALLELCRARSTPVLTSDSCVDLLALLLAVAPVAQGSVPLRITPAGARFVLRGDAAWLQLLASVLGELYFGEGSRRGPLHVRVDRGARGRGALLRLWWVDLHPQQMPALLLALTDAILDLHNGELSLSPGGLLLYWPARRMVCPEVPVGDGVEVRESR